MKTLALLLALPLLAFPVVAQEGPQPVTRASGGSMTLEVEGATLNEGSSLQREWIAVHDAALPVSLAGVPGVSTHHEPASTTAPGGFVYRVWSLELKATVAVSAVEVRFVCFNVWGEHVSTLVYDEIKDREAGSWTSTAAWDLSSRRAASRHYASIAYVSRVRLADGSILTANLKPVLAEARKFAKKFSKAGLEPTPPGK